MYVSKMTNPRDSEAGTCECQARFECITPLPLVWLPVYPNRQQFIMEVRRYLFQNDQEFREKFCANQKRR